MSNLRIRALVSATILDMLGERDELMTHAWPKLRRFCCGRQVELEEADLRRGFAEEQSTRKETVRFCHDKSMPVTHSLLARCAHAMAGCPGMTPLPTGDFNSGNLSVT